MFTNNAAWLFEPPKRSDLDKQTSRNVGINLVAQGIQLTLQAVSVVTLARLLSPADFGLVAMVTIYSSLPGASSADSTALMFP